MSKSGVAANGVAWTTPNEIPEPLAPVEECTASVISKTTAVTLGGGLPNDTRLLGLMITAALTGTCVITGFADSDGTAQSITLPAGAPAGFRDFHGAINRAGALTITCSTAADDNLVTAMWRANKQ